MAHSTGHFITGLVTEMFTAFNEDGSIDYKLTGDCIDFQMEKGVQHFFVNGLGGESHELSKEEHINVLKEVYSRTNGKSGGKLMACAFLNSVYENKALIDMYEETGMADCYCITAPPFFRHTQEALYDYASQLISHCKKPVYIYNCVQMGALFAPETLARLYNEHDNFQGYKDATVDMVHWVKTTMLIDPNKFDFLGGCDGLDGVMMLWGAVGCVSMMAATFPVEMKELVDYGLAGDTEKVIAAQQKIMLFRNVLKLAPFNAAYMYAMKFPGGPVVKHGRMPHDQEFVPDDVKAIIDKQMAELGY